MQNRIVRTLRRKERDLAYILRVREQWRAHEERFPCIVEGLTGQGESIVEDIARLRDEKVRTALTAP